MIFRVPVVVTATLLSAVAWLPLAAQAPNLANGQVGDRTEFGPAPNNPWITITPQLGYTIAGNAEFAEDLLVSSRVIIDQYFVDGGGGWGIPLVGNLSKLSQDRDTLSSTIGKITSSADGLNIGFMPYYEIGGGARVRLTPFGSIGWKLNSGQSKEDSSTVYLHQLRTSLGGAVDVFQALSSSELPLSVSVEFIRSFFNGSRYEELTGTDLSGVSSVDLTGILPLPSNFGLLGQVSLPSQGETRYRIGILFSVREARDTESAANQRPTDPPPVATVRTPAAFTGLVRRRVAATPVIGATVQLSAYSSVSGTNCDGAQIGQAATTQTATDGRFAFSGVGLGNGRQACLIIQVTGSGYQTLVRNVPLNVQVGGEGTHNLGNIDLTPQ